MGLTNPTGSSIKSIQRGASVLLSANTVQTITVSSVDMSKSSLRLNGWYSIANVSTFKYPQVILVSATTFEIRCSAAGTSDINVSWELLENN